MIKKKQTAPYYENSNGGKYIGILEQTGTSAPTETKVYLNTIGEIIWTRAGVGSYLGTLEDAFPEDRTITEQKGDGAWTPLWGTTIGDHYYRVRWNASDSVNVQIRTAGGAPAELSDIGVTVGIDITVFI